MSPESPRSTDAIPTFSPADVETPDLSGPYRILLVDDDPFVRNMLGDLLESEGYTVATAANGREGLDCCLEDRDVELVISDMNMEEMDGLEFIKAFRQHDPQTPIIILTVNDEITVALDALRSGADDYILKDETITETILFSIRRVMEKYLLKQQYLRLLEELQRKNRELERLSFLDGLTGIPNRRYFDKTLRQEWRRTRREELPLSLVMIDIDFFKDYNDAYGHLQGDDCLRQVARTLEASLHRPGDMVFRYGGEEFAAILPGTDAAGATAVAEKIREAVSGLSIPHSRSGVGDTITISLGVATSPPEGTDDREAFIAHADGALYAAKQAGRNRINAAAD